MKRLITKMIMVPVLMLFLSACGGGGPNGGGTGTPSLATIANILGTWLATSNNSEDINEFFLSDINIPDEAGVFVNFDDGSSDVGTLQFTDNNTAIRAIRVLISSGILDGTIQLFNDCQTMELTLNGETGTFSNSGNTCTDN